MLVEKKRAAEVEAEKEEAVLTSGRGHRIGRHASIPEPLTRQEVVSKGASPAHHHEMRSNGSDMHLDISRVRKPTNDPQSPVKSGGGQLWTWGMGRNGKYDRLTSNLREPRPLNLPDTHLQHSLSTITSVACSSSHALFTTRTRIPPRPQSRSLCPC
jgi:hypothetical protein